MKVRVNSLYAYNPVLLDRMANLPLNKGDIVRVVNLHGCPPANTMGQCYVADPETGHFIGMVCCNSLEVLRRCEAGGNVSAGTPSIKGGHWEEKAVTRCGWLFRSWRHREYAGKELGAVRHTL